MSVKYPEGRYVYIHIRNDNGMTFYVGQGKEYRAWSKTGRNKRWTNTVNKHGYSVEIIDSGMDQNQSDELEKFLISCFRGAGHPLVNRTDGGEGVSGFSPTSDQRIMLSRAHGGRSVHCSNGMIFPTVQMAADWLVENGWPKARSGHISACCRGDRTGAYQLSWWYEGGEPNEYKPRYVRLSDTRHKGVNCSNGMWFKTQKLASEWLRENGHPKACQTGVGMACRGVMNTAYGFTWWFGRND